MARTFFDEKQNRFGEREQRRDEENRQSDLVRAGRAMEDYAERPGRWEEWKTRGPFVGRGPKSYRRSDQRIKEDIYDRLTEHGQVDASDIEVEVRETEVILKGFVNTRNENS